MSSFFRLTGVARDAQVLASGDPKKIVHRARNRAVAKGLGAVGFWKMYRRIWR